jgi:ABC-type transport system involved in cytochrome c biogenesis permease subunit
MSPVETTFFYAALVICLTLSVISFFPKGLTQRVYLSLVVLALIFEGAAIGIRWSNTGHPPIFGTFEETLAASWTVILFAIILDRKGMFAHISFPIAAITMLYGLSFDNTAKPVTISEQSLWVDFHALFAWIAYGFYTFSFICALGILFKRPWAEAGEQALYRWLLWGFLAQTIMFVLGSYYSVRLYGAWWVWDTVEYLFVVSWFLYAIPIHGRILYGWEDRRLAGLTVLAMAGTIILYWGLVYFPWTTYHIFDTELVVHG